jgi:two-component system sensor histidine kinase HydH
VEEHILEEIKRYVGFDGADGERLRAMAPRVAPHAEAVSTEFYERIVAHPGASKSITGGDTQVFALRHTLTGWIRELFEGPWDLAWYERRARIGRRHVEIDLPQQYMFTAMNTIRGALTRILSETAETHEGACLDVLALDRLLDIELAVMLHTYREDTLARLQRTERLATVGQFAASIAHELRNPLGVIESSSFLLRKRIGEPTDAVTRHLDKIDAQVRVSNRIITGLLDLVRDVPATPREVPANELLAAALEAVPQCTQRVEVTAEPGVRVRVDPDQFRQILVNLLTNACDAAGPAGRVAASLRADGPDAVFVVSDDGPGIAPEIQARLFEPLVSTKVRGIGLGLALCRRLAERNGARVTLTDGPLRGAAFEVRVARLGEAP